MEDKSLRSLMERSFSPDASMRKRKQRSRPSSRQEQDFFQRLANERKQNETARNIIEQQATKIFETYSDDPAELFGDLYVENVPSFVKFNPFVESAIRKLDDGKDLSKEILPSLRNDILNIYFPDQFKKEKEIQMLSESLRQREQPVQNERQRIKDLEAMQKRKTEMMKRPISMPQGFSIGGRTRLI
mgnify:FL=1